LAAQTDRLPLKAVAAAVLQRHHAVKALQKVFAVLLFVYVFKGLKQRSLNPN
jgi:hypothetical protein